MPAGGLRAGKGLQRCWLCRGTQEAVALLLNWGQWLGWDRMVRKKQPAERRGLWRGLTSRRGSPRVTGWVASRHFPNRIEFELLLFLGSWTYRGLLENQAWTLPLRGARTTVPSPFPCCPPVASCRTAFLEV